MAIAEEIGDHFDSTHTSIVCAAKSVCVAIRQTRARRGSVPDRHRRRKAAGRAQSWPARSLALAKLYQSTIRPVDAHAVLAPALEGFSPTAEMPEIAEAQALLVAIEAGAHVRHE